MNMSNSISFEREAQQVLTQVQTPKTTDPQINLKVDPPSQLPPQSTPKSTPHKRSADDQSDMLVPTPIKKYEIKDDDSFDIEELKQEIS